jgi:hypothetical protein
MLVFDQLETVADKPLNVTDPAVAVKLSPEIVTDVPGTPFPGEIELIIGATVTGAGMGQGLQHGSE